MKKVLSLFALLFIAGSITAQIYSPPALPAKAERRQRVDSTDLFPTGCGAPWALSTLDKAQKHAARYFDSCNHRFYVYDPKLDAWDTIHVGVAGSGGGSTNTSIGSAFKLAVNGTNNIKSLANTWGLVLDSATSGQVGIKVDTTSGKVATKTDLLTKWDKSGNAGTIAGTNFIGTTDAVDLVFKTDNTEIARFTGDGANKISFGTATATGVGAVAFGSVSGAIGDISFATGAGTGAYGYASFSSGNQSYASGYHSAVFGYGNTSKSYNGTVVGSYNDSTNATSSSSFNTANRAFQIGIGTANNARANAMTVLFNGNIGIGTTTPSYKLHVKESAISGSITTSYFESIGATTSNIALRLKAANAVENIALAIENGEGSVGIGTLTPAAILHTVGTVRHASLGTASSDTTTYKPVGITSLGDIIPMTAWPGGASSNSLTNLLNINQVPHSGIVVNQDSVIIFGDSYVYGTGATSAAYGWASILSKYMNAVLDNRGVDGTTLEKRTPVNWVGGAATNMIDLLSTVPVKTAKKKLLIIALALNDWGYNGGQYNPANYKTDYDSVMNYITNTKGWPAKNVLIISPYWIGAAGRTQYAGYSGNAAPTYAQALVFIDSTKAVADQWGTLYFDIYHDQLRNDTTLFNGGTPIHPDDSGHLYIARDIYSYLAPNIQLWKQNTTNEVMPYFATNTPASTTTPASINLGASYASSAGLPGSTKLKLYYDGTTNNTGGFGVSTAGVEGYIFSGGTFDYYVNGSKIASIGAGATNFTSAMRFSGYGAGALTTDGSGNITAVSDSAYKIILSRSGVGLQAILKLNPAIFKWNTLSGYNQDDVNTGFIAQEVQRLIPNSTGKTKDGHLTLMDRPITAALVNSVKELYEIIQQQQKEINELKSKMK